MLITRPRRAPTDPAQARAVAELLGWDYLLTTGRLRVIAGPVADPGNPAGVLILLEDRSHAFGHVRILLAINATPEPDGRRRLVGLYVPADMTDPVRAAAWTYDDEDHPIRTTATVYAAINRRT